MTDTMPWVESAACRAAPPETFFPRGADPALAEPAKSICRRCPVIRDCLLYALQHAVDGVWGATTTVERDRLRLVHRITAHPVFIDLPTDRIGTQVEAMTRKGASIAQIAVTLRVSEHTVSYHRALAAVANGDHL